jgi:hypothetical protein
MKRIIARGAICIEYPGGLPVQVDSNHIYYDQAICHERHGIPGGLPIGA